MSIRPFNNLNPRIAASAWIDPCACVIGDVDIGERVSVWPMAVVRADVNHISIGEDTNIQDAAVLHATHDGPYTPGGIPLKLGRGVTVGHKAVLHACDIGDYCLIGIAAVVMDGATLGHKVMLGAGALVPPGKKLEAGHLYVGTPATKRRALTEQELESLEYSAQHYLRLAKQHRQGNSV